MPQNITDEYVLVIFSFLTKQAEAGKTTTYGELADHVSQMLRRKCIARGMGRHLFKIKDLCAANHLPALTVLVLRKDAKRPGKGLFEGMGDLTPEAKERKFRQLLAEVHSFEWNDAAARFGISGTLEAGKSR